MSSSITSFFLSAKCPAQHITDPISTSPLMPYASFSGWCTAGRTGARQSPSIKRSFLAYSCLYNTSRTHQHITSRTLCLVLRLVHSRARRRQTVSVRPSEHPSWLQAPDSRSIVSRNLVVWSFCLFCLASLHPTCLAMFHFSKNPSGWRFPLKLTQHAGSLTQTCDCPMTIYSTPLHKAASQSDLQSCCQKTAW